MYDEMYVEIVRSAYCLRLVLKHLQMYENIAETACINYGENEVWGHQVINDLFRPERKYSGGLFGLGSTSFL